jgi:cytochrome c oxidase subunit I+III
MSARTLDVSQLPEHAFGHKGIVWWGTVSFIVIEGSMFVLLIASYLFLRTRVAQWPPSAPPPALTPGVVNLVLMLVSVIPNHLVAKAAERFDLRAVRVGMLVCLAFGVAFVAVRWFEFEALNVRWDSSAYGSIVWVLLGLHTFHVLTDVVDTAVLTALMFTAHTEKNRFVDVSDNGLYWYFVVIGWIPLYLLIYFGPRWL